MSSLRFPKSIVLAAVAVALGGCQGTVQEAFGMRKRAPDEFQVVRRQPLIVPPDRNLRPPRPGETGPAEPPPAESARAALVGQRASRSETSRGETALLEAVRVQAEPDIRRRLAEDNSQLVLLDEGTFLFILDWQRRRAQQQGERGEALDAVAEARRLQEAGRVQTVRRGSEGGG